MAQLEYDKQFKHDPDQGNVSDIKIENEDIKPDCSDLSDFQHPLGLTVCSSDELFDSEIKKQPELCEEQNAKLELEQEEADTVKKIPQKRLKGVKRKLDVCSNVSTSDVDLSKVEVNEDFDAEADNEDDIEQKKKKREVVVNTSTIPTEGTTPQPASETMNGNKEVEATPNIVMADHLDTELLIVEVQKRPSLWDTSTEEYKDKNKKVVSWEDVCTSLIEGYEEKSTADKNNIGKQLQRKWKSVRDCYTRERQRLAKIKSGSSVSRKTQYVFYNQLSFLQRVIRFKDTSNNMKEAAAEERPSNGEQPPTSSAVQSVEAGRGKRKKVDKISPVVECLVNVLQTGMQAREEREKRKEDDDDRLFLLSLLNPLKKIPEHLRFGVRMQIMQVIHNATPKDVSYNLNP